MGTPPHFEASPRTVVYTIPKSARRTRLAGLNDPAKMRTPNQIRLGGCCEHQLERPSQLKPTLVGRIVDPVIERYRAGAQADDRHPVATISELDTLPTISQVKSPGSGPCLRTISRLTRKCYPPNLVRPALRT